LRIILSVNRYPSDNLTQIKNLKEHGIGADLRLEFASALLEKQLLHRVGSVEVLCSAQIARMLKRQKFEETLSNSASD